MTDEGKTRSGGKQAAPREGETIAARQAGETWQCASGQQPGASPQTTTGQQPGASTLPPPSPETVQAQVEYRQILNQLAVASPSVGAPPALQPACNVGFWCLPDVNCSARDFTSDAVRDAFFDNRSICVSGRGIGLGLVDGFEVD
jgi:hypothetical protein